MVPVRVVIALGVMALYGAGCAQQRPDGIFDGAVGAVHPAEDSGEPAVDAGPGTDDTGPGTDDTGAVLDDTGPGVSTGDDAGPLVLDTGTGTGTDPCAAHRTCTSCGAASGCGWCGTTGTCASGTSRGPRAGTCAGAWGTAASACGTTGGGTGTCSGVSACGACTALNNCGWCATTGRCEAGTVAGPLSGSCAASAWSWVPTDCTGTTGGGGGTDPCASVPACGTCITNSHCGWCLNTMTCHYATTRRSGPDDGACSGSTWAYSATYCTH